MDKYMSLLFGILLLWISLLSLVSGHDSVAFTFELPDNDKQCFYQRFKESKRMTIFFEVIRGGHNDVDFILESPNGLEVYKATKTKKDTVNFESSYGIYTFCFSNEFSTFTHKVVYFELRPEGHESLSDLAGIKKPSANTQVEETLEHIFRNVAKVQGVQGTFRLQESRGRHLAEDLSDRVQLWSMCEAFVIVLMGMGQVFVLKRFFAHIRPPPSGETKAKGFETPGYTHSLNAQI